MSQIPLFGSLHPDDHDQHPDLDIENARREEQEAVVRLLLNARGPRLCECDRPILDREGGLWRCAKCGRRPRR